MRGTHAYRGITMRCRLSLLTNSAFVYESQCGGWGGGGAGFSANEYRCAHHVTKQGAQINFGDLPPYLLTYGAYGFMLSGIVLQCCSLYPVPTYMHVYYENNSAVWSGQSVVDRFEY
jgi:hypothetical protein